MDWEVVVEVEKVVDMVMVTVAAGMAAAAAAAVVVVGEAILRPRMCVELTSATTHVAGSVVVACTQISTRCPPQVNRHRS